MKIRDKVTYAASARHVCRQCSHVVEPTEGKCASAHARMGKHTQDVHSFRLPAGCATDYDPLELERITVKAREYFASHPDALKPRHRPAPPRCPSCGKIVKEGELH